VVATTDLPTTPSHPFYARLNHLLRERGFDDFAEAQCAACNAGAARSAELRASRQRRGR
jgi:hypothetical protein